MKYVFPEFRIHLSTLNVFAQLWCLHKDLPEVEAAFPSRNEISEKGTREIAPDARVAMTMTEEDMTKIMKEGKRKERKERRGRRGRRGRGKRGKRGKRGERGT